MADVYWIASNRLKARATTTSKRKEADNIGAGSSPALTTKQNEMTTPKKKVGRPPLADPRVIVQVNVKKSIVEANGGKAKLAKMLRDELEAKQ